MIGWYVDVGYSDKSKLTSLDDITFTDLKKPFTVITNINVSSDVVNFNSNSEVADDALNSLGEDYYYLYSAFGNPDTTETETIFEIWRSVIPSLQLAYPDFNSELKNNLVYYFKSLNKVLYQTSFNYVFVYEVSGSELIEKVKKPWDNFDSINFMFSSFSSTRALIKVDGVYRIWASSVKYRTYSPSRSIYTNSNVTNICLTLFSNSEPDFEGNIPPVNPYDPGGNSGEGGGGGTFDGDSDQISDSPLPTLSCADTGFTRIYTPTLAQVQNLARYLWTDESIVDTFWNVVKRYFEDPMQAFISFSIVPVPVPVAGTEEFKVLFIPTGVMLNTVANQFVDVDCGTFEMKEYYGSALDYSPNTKVSCYLPYIGTVSLNTDDVMGRTLQVKYRVDICSGSCVAKILVDGNVIYQFPGCCHVPIPFTSADFASYGSAIISAVKTGIAAYAAGVGNTELGAGILGMNAGQQTGDSYTKTVVNTERNPATGRQITTGTQKVTKEITGTKASFNGIVQTGIANTANAVTASKAVVERSGSFSGNSGYLGVRRPYLIIERPRMCMPSNYQQLNGFPSMITTVLSECSGYTRVQQVQLTGVEATNPEQAEVLELLKGGVIF